MKQKAKVRLAMMCLCALCLSGAALVNVSSASADDASALADARANTNENLLARKETNIGGDYRSGYHNYISYSDNKITVTRPSGNARVGTVLSNSALAKQEVFKNEEAVSTATLSAYYAADMTFGDYGNTYSTYGLTVAKTISGDSTTYHTITLEQGRGFIHYYTYTTKPNEAEKDSAPYTKQIPDVMTKGTPVKMEIIKTGDDFNVYLNEQFYITQKIENAIPTFGTMMFGTDVMYENMVFKYLDEGLDVDTPVSVPETLKAAREAQGTSATGLGETVMSDNLRSTTNFVQYSNGAIVSDCPCTGNWAAAANMLTDGYLSQESVTNADGEMVATSSVGALVSADVSYTEPVIEYRKIGVLFGHKAEGAATRFYAFLYEPSRGFAFISSFLRDADGTVSSEKEVPVCTTNLGFAADKKLKFEIIVENDGVSAYINNTEVVNKIAEKDGLSLTGITPIVGSMFKEMKGTVSNMALKYLKPVTFKIPLAKELEAARENDMILTQSALNLGRNIRAKDAMLAYENGVGTSIKDGNRDVRMFGNVNLRQNEAYVNDELVSTSTLSVYYKAELTYKEKKDTYANFGILIGKNTVGDNTRYYTLTVEPHRGFVFIYWFDVSKSGTTTQEGNLNVCVNKDIGIVANEKATLEVIKNGDAVSVYWNGVEAAKNFTNDGFKNVTPVFGLSTYAVGGQYENLQMKVLTENYETYIADTRPTYTTENKLADVEKIDHATKGDNGFTFANNEEYYSMVASAKDYVYVNNNDVYTRVDDSTLTSYVQAKLTFGDFADPQKSWYGAGITFRGQYENRYSIRFIGSSVVLMHYGTEITSAGIEAIGAGSEVLLQILSTPDKVSVWVNGNIVLEDVELEHQYKCTFGVWSIFNAVTVSDMSMQYAVEVYDENPNASNDATLKYINLDGVLVEGFTSDKTEYTFEFAKGTSIPVASQFTVEANHEYATTEIVMENDVLTVTVTAEDNTQKVYTITYLVERNTDSTLKELTIDGVAITLEAGKTEYEYTMPAHQLMPKADEVVAVANDTLATAEVVMENGVATITVTAEDGSVTTYTVTVSLNLSSNTKLASISVKGEMIKDFAADKFEYTYEYTESVMEEDIEFICEDEYANASFVFQDGVATIAVTAEDGTTATYTVTFTEKTSSAGVLAGCKSSVGVGLAAMALLGVAALCLRKKED